MSRTSACGTVLFCAFMYSWYKRWRCSSMRFSMMRNRMACRVLPVSSAYSRRSMRKLLNGNESNGIIRSVSDIAGSFLATRCQGNQASQRLAQIKARQKPPLKGASETIRVGSERLLNDPTTHILRGSTSGGGDQRKERRGKPSGPSVAQA